MKLRTAFLAIATLALVGLFWSVPHPASAAAITYSPDAPRPVNVLPSTVAHLGRTTGVAAPKSAQAMAFFLYNAMQTPEFWKAAQAQKAGQALTVAQNNVITTVQKNTRVPAGPIAALARGGAQMVVIEAGLMMGGGAVDLFWPDRQGIVCANTGTDPLGELTAWAARADCSDKRILPDANFVPNSDVTPGVVWGTVCGGGACMTPLDYGQHTDAFGRLSSVIIFNVDKVGTVAGFYVRLAPGTSGCASTSPCDAALSLTDSTSSTQYQKAVTLWDQSTWTHVNGNVIGEFNSPTARPLVVEGFRYGTTGPVVGNTSTPADPERTMRCVILGSNGQTYSGAWYPYKESDDAYPQPKCATLPAEVIPQESWIETTYPGGDVQRLWSQETAPEVITAHNAYPLCRDQLCPTELYKGETNCHVNPTGCLNWFEDPNKTATYQCKYGPYAVTLGECTIYAQGFRTAPGSTTTTNPDTLSDPETGAPLESPFPSGRDADTFAETPSDSSTPRECFPTGWAALNPVEWVFRPVQCAFEWAFIPRQSALQDQYDRIIPLYLDTMPGQLNAAVASWEFSAPATHCNGISLDMSWIPGQSSIQMLNACPGDPLEPFAGWAKFFFYVAFTVVGTLGSIRNAASTVGYRGLGGDS